MDSSLNDCVVFFNRGKVSFNGYNIRVFFYLIFKKCDLICAIELDTILPVLAVAKMRRKIVGYGVHELRHLVDKLDIDGKVEFLGIMSPEQIEAVTPIDCPGLNSRSRKK